MARYKYVILARGHAGRDDEFGRWYDAQHLGDVLRLPGVIGGARYPLAFQKVYDLDAPRYTSMTIYDIETDDPQGFIEAIAALSGSEAMPATDALDKSGMIQVVGLIRED